MGLFKFGKNKKKEEIPPINKLVDNDEIDKYSLPSKEDNEIANIDTSTSKDDKEEDLFNLNDFDINQEGDSKDTKMTSEIERGEKEDGSSLTNENINQDKLEDTIDTENLEINKEYTFSKNPKVSEKEFFITTSQFKKLLEIIDNVKLKVKHSNDLYLKLADIKSEEDVEFENLRKAYIYIEERLYELDKTIFEE